MAGTSFGGDNINHGNQALGDGDVVADGGVKGDGNTVTNTINKAGGAWTDVYDYVASEVPEDARDAVSAAVIDLQEKVESEADVSQYDSILEILKPYKPLGDLLVKAAPGIASMVTAAFA